jgi:hypothetical protein
MLNRRMARIASLAVVGLFVACGGGEVTSTGSIPNTREQADAGRDDPGAARDTPPPSEDTPPGRTGPSGGGVAAQCLPCGKYTCSGTEGGKTLKDQGIELKATATAGACQLDDALFKCDGTVSGDGATAVGSWARGANGVVTIKAPNVEISCTIK